MAFLGILLKKTGETAETARCGFSARHLAAFPVFRVFCVDLCNLAGANTNTSGFAVSPIFSRRSLSFATTSAKP
jgi:hypothetical protein